MTMKSHSRCQKAIDEIRSKTNRRLKSMIDLCKQMQNDRENPAYFKVYSETMADLAFDVIEHAVRYSVSAEELEAFKERLHYTDHALGIALDVLTGSEQTHLDWRTEFEREMHYH
jgi:hypothetical protein